MPATALVTGAPAWVYFLLIALVALGVRRLKTREVPVFVALIPSTAFFIWSMFGVQAFAAWAGLSIAIGAWLIGALAGAISGYLLPEPRGERLPTGRVRQPGTPIPLVLYLGVFIVRYACGVWAAIVPVHATAATAIGVAASAAVMARMLLGIVRWRPASAKQIAV